MTTYKAPVDDIRFVLNEVIDVQRYANLPGMADAAPDLVDAILTEGAKFCEEVLQPLNEVGDRQGCTMQDSEVRTPDGFKRAFEMFVEAGWPSLGCDPAYGGQGLPNYVTLAFNEMVSSANMAFGMYPGLTHGAYEAIITHGSDEQKATYLPNMVSGKWTGTMNLTEPHCGTDLGLMRTKAEPQADGSYRISGTKIFISSGEHDLAENIIHLVLAKILDAPEGIRGVSLFIVPKFLVNEDGSLGARNGVTCGSIEEKMGIHGNSTCVMNYDGAVGFLVGEAHKGMRAMFTMMNEARLGVGLQGFSQSEVSYQNALAYARERLQGRALTGTKNPESAADPIIVHPDVRRMLMNQKAFNEAARALCLWSAVKADIVRRDPDEAAREAAEDFLALITPVVKGYLTDKAFENCVNAQQVFGGHGYIVEHGMEQFVRDCRISMIYEGTNGIQALDLVGRKLAMKGGKPVMDFMDEIEAYANEAGGDDRLKPYLEGLRAAHKDLEAATTWFMENALENFDHAGAGSTDYMHLFGITAFAYMWARMADVALKGLGNGTNQSFYEAKLATGKYFMDRIRPETASLLAKITAGAESMMALKEEDFALAHGGQ